MTKEPSPCHLIKKGCACAPGMIEYIYTAARPLRAANKEENMRKISMLLAVIMLAGLFCACGKGKEPAPAVTNEPEALATETVRPEPTATPTATPVPTQAPKPTVFHYDLDIPVYNERKLILRMPIWEDECRHDGGSAIYMHEMRDIFDEFPTDAVRVMPNGSKYAIYDTDTGYRLFVIYDNLLDIEKLPLTARGFPILVKELHSYSEFASLKTGDPIAKAAETDPVAGIVMSFFDGKSNYYNYIHDGAVRGWAITSFHYLTDGVLKIEYDMTEDGDLFIIDMVYAEDYELTSNNGLTINYKLFDCDLPQP